MVTMPLSGLLINRFRQPGDHPRGHPAPLRHAALPDALRPISGRWRSSFCFFGCGIGAVDVAMNAQAVVVEQKMGKPIMSSFHGAFLRGRPRRRRRREHPFATRHGSDPLLPHLVSALSIVIGIWQFSRLLRSPRITR